MMAGLLVFYVTLGLCSACSMVNLMCGAFRRSFVKGSRPRYIVATIQRITMWPGLLAFLVAAGLAARDRAWWDLFCAGGGCACWVLFYLWQKDDDDDDWFKGAKKRLKTWAQSRSFGLGFSPGSA